MELKITSRKTGRTITFSRPGKEYTWADLNGKSGTLGLQICHGGGTDGSTMSYSGEDQVEFEAICRRWYKVYMNRFNA